MTELSVEVHGFDWLITRFVGEAPGVARPGGIPGRRPPNRALMIVMGQGHAGA